MSLADDLARKHGLGEEEKEVLNRYIQQVESSTDRDFREEYLKSNPSPQLTAAMRDLQLREIRRLESQPS